MASRFLGVTIEVERCYQCDSHKFCTRHHEQKYSAYSDALQDKVSSAIDRAKIDYRLEFNPGPATRGMNCMKLPHNPFLWVTMKMDPNTRKWHPDLTFRYPTVGAFEIYVSKPGYKRTLVFSKLQSRRWPNMAMVIERIFDIVESRFEGWAHVHPDRLKKREDPGTLLSISDEELRHMVSRHQGQTLVSAFRAMDFGGDGLVNKGEFVKGLKHIGMDLPKCQYDRLWELADINANGTIDFVEFSQRFSRYKYTKAVHRKGSRTDFGTRRRTTEEHSWGVPEHQAVDRWSLPVSPKSASQRVRELATQDWSRVPIEDMTADQVRARILQVHGSWTSAFRHFDIHGQSRIDFERFKAQLPKVFHQQISDNVLVQLWGQFDSDADGLIDMNDLSRQTAGFSRTTLEGRKMKDLVRQPSESSPSRSMLRSASFSAAPDLVDGDSARNSSRLGALPPLVTEDNGGYAEIEDYAHQGLVEKRMYRPESASTLASTGQLGASGSMASLFRPDSASTLASAAPGQSFSMASLPVIEAPLPETAPCVEEAGPRPDADGPTEKSKSIDDDGFEPS
mmetsp:Transcript_23084/g.50828  ORF Transcript_23084/g.50828 Transcript_23084/m.50828 type:complete len:565 (-) Transcript_23084:353-2047(-)|eukprot:CAMPEP_0204276656 /NCGR_PEP_ID=MMETSP0468-20130131/28576_1 /ASSEMBLY_ACC=CAM_ASM_000383 /TAXON_ID=2969 /ORGANISM="Oxyrrhis marina" /LENGTH=564 /DNA_ID=CAMNT_0051253317 /DNA_START=71 /DNA_END=1765 /DNA_ORIENTATION=+